VNNLKFGVLACGLIGLISVFLPQITFGDQSISLWGTREAQAGQVYLIMAAFLAPLVMGALAAAKPPMQRWQGIVAIAGFALIVVKMRDALPADFMKGAIGMKLMGLSAIIGLVVSILTVAKPETAK
jgi:hypothetical protein